MKIDGLVAGRETDALMARIVLDEPFTQEDYELCGYGAECDGSCYFSTSIPGMWKIIDKMTGGMVQFRLEKTSSVNWRYYAKFVDCADQIIYGASADTAPLAVCRAAMRMAGYLVAYSEG